jgi:hypothetical protein
VDGAVSMGTADANASSLEIEHTTGSGSNRLMLVGVSWSCGTTDRTISSVTFTPDGEGSAIDLTHVKTELGYDTSNPRYSAIYSLIDPPISETGTVTVTFSGGVSGGIVGGVINFAGVDQDDPIGALNGANGVGTDPSVQLTGLNGNEYVLDNLFMGSASTSQTVTAGGGQTQQWTGLISSTCAAGSIKQVMGGSSVTMSWTASASRYWAIVAVAINPATEP